MNDPDFSPRLAPVISWMNSPDGQAQSARYQEQCRLRNNEQVRRYRNARMARDLGFKHLSNWRQRLTSCLFKKWSRPGAIPRNRSDKTIMDLVGCTYQALRDHMQSQFKPGMTWENHGKTGWHIDHKRPVWEFDWDDATQFAAMNHWTNLQPLWHYENRAKGLIEARLSRASNRRKK